MIPNDIHAPKADERWIVRHHISHAGLLVGIAVENSVATANRQIARMRNPVGESEARSEVVSIDSHEAARLSSDSRKNHFAEIRIGGIGNKIPQLVLGIVDGPIQLITDTQVQGEALGDFPIVLKISEVIIGAEV